MKRLIMLAALICSAAAFLGAEEALARLSVVSMRSEPRHGAEQISQALMGTPVRVLEHGREWSRVSTPEGYEGWIINHSLAFKTDEEMARWRRSPRVIVTAPYELHDRDGRTDLVSGDVMEAVGTDSLRLPDGRMIFRPEGAVEPLESVCGAEFCPEELPDWAAKYMGVPYLWGGLSSKGMDCSGLVRMAYMAQGRILPRDAWQQALEGVEVSPDSLKPGDLIFFGNKRITHVGIYAGGGEYVHSSQMVRRNSLDPASPLYLPLKVLARRRVSGVIPRTFFQ